MGETAVKLAAEKTKIGWAAVAVLLGLLLTWLPLPWAAGLLVVTVVLLTTMIHPLSGLLLTLLAAPLGALENVIFGPSWLDSGQLLLAVTLAAWIGRGLAARRLTIRHTFLNLPLSLFIFVAALSLLRAPSLLFGFKELLKWLQIALVMLMVGDLVRARPSPAAGHRAGRFPLSPTYTVLLMLLLAGLSQALVGIWQFGLRGDGPEHFLVLGRFYRAYGTFEQPNPYAGYMNLTALLAMGVFLGGLAGAWFAWRKKTPAGWRRWGALLFVGGTAVLATLAVLFSWSRGAWLSLAAGTAVLVLFWPQKRWQGVALLLLAGLLFGAGVQTGLVPPAVSDRLSSFSQDLRFGDVRGVDINDANYAVLERLAHWQAALDMARDQVWLGVGFGNYEPVYPDYALINWPYPLGHAHNYYLNLLAEVGLLGLGAYLWLWTAVFWQTVRQLNRLEWPRRGLALGLLAAWTAVTVHHLVDKLYVNNIYIHLGVMFALLQLLESECSPNRTKVALNGLAGIR